MTICCCGIRLLKTPMAATLLLFFTLLLSACSGAGAGNTITNGDTQLSTNQTVEAQPQTRIVSTIKGVVKVPEHPKRIVVTIVHYAGYPLVLGVKPVGLPAHAFNNSWYDGLIDGVVNIGDNESSEQVLEMNPDLIITLADSKNLENLKKIAPTIGISYGDTDFKGKLREFGKILGEEEKAAEWIASWDKKIAEYKPRFQELFGDKTISIFSVNEKEIYAYGATFGRGGEILYTELGLKAPELIQKEAIDGTVGWTLLSLEMLQEYAGEYILVEKDRNYETMIASALWKDLPAVKNNRIIPFDGLDFSSTIPFP